MAFYDRKKILSGESDTETGYKFDARLRYVENLLNAWILVIQSEADRQTKNLTTPQLLNWKSNVYTLYYLLSLHDDGLNEPDMDNIDEDYIRKLVKHSSIKEVTDNKLKFSTWEEEVDKDY